MPTTRYSVFDGEIVSESRAGVLHDYVSDPLGNTVALLDNTQTQTDQWSYFPYGESVRIKGTTATPVTFVGRKSCRQDSSATRSYMQHRFLDMPKARWITEDPIRFAGGDLSLFRYVRNNPTVLVDFSGLGGHCSPPDSSRGCDRFKNHHSDPTSCQDCADEKLLGILKKQAQKGLKEIADCLKKCASKPADDRSECVSDCIGQSGDSGTRVRNLQGIKRYLECTYSICISNTSKFDPPSCCSDCINPSDRHKCIECYKKLGLPNSGNVYQ